MADNSSLTSRWYGRVTDRLVTVQILVAIFLSINFLLIFTFFSKDIFHTSVRYILFALMLCSDSIILMITDILLVLLNFQFSMLVGLCIIFYIISGLYVFVTPVTLTAMTLERYVAICMPLRHGEICSMYSAVHFIVIIHVFSFVPCIVTLSTFLAIAPLTLYTQKTVCSVEILMLHSWQSHLRSAISQFYFLVMFIIIVFAYVKIMKVAKAASGENKQSSRKGLRTVILHAFQLLLCLIHLWWPFIEAAVVNMDQMLFINFRFFNYVTFILTPRCLSPLIYGLRDEQFFRALKSSILCGFHCVKNK